MNDENEDMKILLPISILLEEMKCDHSSTRIYCLQNLSTIGSCQSKRFNFIKLFSKTELELKQKLSIYCGKLVVFIKLSKTIYKGYLVQIQQYMKQLIQEKNFMIKQDSVILILKIKQQIEEIIINKKIFNIFQDFQ